MEKAGGQKPEEIKDGRYANNFSIGHNAYEVILQFGQFYEGNQNPVMHTTIVTSPAYMQETIAAPAGRGHGAIREQFRTDPEPGVRMSGYTVIGALNTGAAHNPEDPLVASMIPPALGT